MTQLPAAVLWDMDGTLIDTEPFWMEAETVLVEQYGGTWTHEEALSLVGQGLWHSARVLQSHGVDLTEDEIIANLTATVRARVETGGLPWRPGARELLRSIRAAGIPTALVTMSNRDLAASVAAAIDFPAFDLVVAGDDVTHAKPHPEPYLVAAERLGVDITRSIAIEDSNPGTASAVAAGATTIGVPLYSSLPPASGFTIWPTLEGRTVDDLSALLLAADPA